MRSNTAILLLLVSLAIICPSDSAQEKKVLSECAATHREHGSIPGKPFKFGPGESYKRSPVVKFRISEDGGVSQAKIVRSSGVSDIDEKVLEAITKWKYKARPGCGVLDSEMSVLVHWE
jgi:TonB family protein